jgi:hypothetical protein
MLVTKLGPDLRPDSTCVVRVSKMAQKPHLLCGWFFNFFITLFRRSENQVWYIITIFKKIKSNKRNAQKPAVLCEFLHERGGSLSLWNNKKTGCLILNFFQKLWIISLFILKFQKIGNGVIFIKKELPTQHCLRPQITHTHTHKPLWKNHYS